MHLRFAALALAAVAAAGAGPEWKPLFDGKSFAGWRDPRKLTPPGHAWTLDNGCIKAVPNAAITEDLVSEEEYGNFELAWDWRIAPGANSGVKYRIQEFVFIDENLVKIPWVRWEDAVDWAFENRMKRALPAGPAKKAQSYVVGFEYQLIDDGRHADAKRGANYQAGALYAMAPATQAAARKPGEWNEGRIVVRGDRVEHWLNGVKVVDTSLGSEEVRASIEKRWGQNSPVYKLLTSRPKRRTPISLQNHGDDAWFRNIRIRILPD